MINQFNELATLNQWEKDIQKNVNFDISKDALKNMFQDIARKGSIEQPMVDATLFVIGSELILNGVSNLILDYIEREKVRITH